VNPLIRIEIVKCINVSDNNLFIEGSYYPGIISPMYNRMFVYADFRNINSNAFRELTIIEKLLKVPEKYEHFKFLYFKNKKELKEFKKYFFIDQSRYLTNFKK
jgi:hypothetical protein